MNSNNFDDDGNAMMVAREWDAQSHAIENYANLRTNNCWNVVACGEHDAVSHWKVDVGVEYILATDNFLPI